MIKLVRRRRSPSDTLKTVVFNNDVVDIAIVKSSRINGTGASRLNIVDVVILDSKVVAVGQGKGVVGIISYL